MPKTGDINRFLDWLEASYQGRGFVFLSNGRAEIDSLPWFRRYVWLSRNFVYGSPDNFSKPTEEPADGDSFFLVVRNFGFGEYSAEFRCEAKIGKITFERAGADGTLEISVLGPANPGFEPMPFDEKSPIRLSDLPSHSELIKVEVVTSDEEGQVVNECSRPLVFRFD